MNDVPSAVMDMIFICCSTVERLTVIKYVSSLWLSISQKSSIVGNVDLSQIKQPLNIRFFTTQLQRQHLNQHHLTSLQLNYVSSFKSIDYFSNLHTLSFNCDSSTVASAPKSENHYLTSLSLLISLSTLSIGIVKPFCSNLDKQWIILPTLRFLLNLTVVNVYNMTMNDGIYRYCISEW